MKNIVKILLCLLFISVISLPLVAQDQIDIIEIENSMLMGYAFDADDYSQTQRFGVNFNLGDSLDAGLLFQQTGFNYDSINFLRLKYTVADKVAVGLLFGNGTNIATGMQVSYDMLVNNIEAISTVMRMNLEYLVEDVTAGLDQGIFGISISIGFGI